MDSSNKSVTVRFHNLTYQLPPKSVSILLDKDRAQKLVVALGAGAFTILVVVAWGVGAFRRVSRSVDAWKVWLSLKQSLYMPRRYVAL